MERRHAFIQSDKKCARIGDVRLCRKQPLRLELRRQLLFDFISRFLGLFGVFFDPLDRIEGMPAVRRRIFCRRGCASPRWTLRRCAPCPHGETQGQNQNNYDREKTMSFHVYPSCEYFAFQLEAAEPHLNFSRPHRICRRYTSEDGTPSIGHAGRSYRGLLLQTKRGAIEGDKLFKI